MIAMVIPMAASMVAQCSPKRPLTRRGKQRLLGAMQQLPALPGTSVLLTKLAMVSTISMDTLSLRCLDLIIAIEAAIAALCRPRLTKRCQICHRQIWVWQGRSSPAKYHIVGYTVKPKRHQVCSRACANVLYNWAKAKMGVL
jgi:hypothetical protein